MDRWTTLQRATLFLAMLLTLVVPLITASSEVLRLLTTIWILGLWALSFNLMLGYTGLLSFGHALFFGVGAYTVGIASHHFDLSSMLAIIIALPAGALLALVAAPLSFRGRGITFALLTLALSQVAFALVLQLESVTRGSDGIYGIARAWVFATPHRAYLSTTIIVIASMALLRMLVASPFGAVLQLIEQNRDRASYLGISVRRYELAVFVVASSVASFSGALFGAVRGFAFPDMLHWTNNAEPLIMVTLGGIGSFLGPLVGAVFIGLLRHYVQDSFLYVNLLLGGALIVVPLGAPTGLLGFAGRCRRSRRSQRKSHEPEPPDRQTSNSVAHGRDMTSF